MSINNQNSFAKIGINLNTSQVYPIADSYPESISQDLQRVQKKLLDSKKTKSNRSNLTVLPGELQPVKNQSTDFYCKHKFAESVKPKSKKPANDTIYKCSPGFIQGVGTATGKQYFKILTCGLEWCAQCGEMHSHSHERRILRLFDKICKLHSLKNSIGYLVVTIPANLRSNFLNKDSLNDFRTYWRRKLKREGYEAGIIRYHWAGEDETNWKPHLNILLPEKFIDRNILNRWRAELAIWFQKYCNTDKPAPPNIWYQYSNNLQKAKFWLRYVTRATMRNYHQHASSIIKGFINTTPFGQFKKIENKIESQIIESQIIKGKDVDENTGEIGTIVWLKKYNANKNKWQPDLLPLREFVKLKTKILSAGFWILEPDIPNLAENSNICGQSSQLQLDLFYLQAQPKGQKTSKLTRKEPQPDW
jgi:hypothetical protein